MKTGQQYRVVIIDDEPNARGLLRELIEADAEIDIVGEAGQVQEAVDLIVALAPDIVFLDVQLSDGDGFEILTDDRTVPRPAIVFVTAFSEHAIRAFSHEALDYVLKPFDEDRIGEALKRAKQRCALERHARRLRQIVTVVQECGDTAAAESWRAADRWTRRLAVRERGRVTLVNVGDIEWIEANGNRVRIHTAAKNIESRNALSNLSRDLDPTRFVRVHRSAIVNVERVQEVQPWFHGEYVILLKDGTKIFSGRAYRAGIDTLLGRH